MKIGYKCSGVILVCAALLSGCGKNGFNIVQEFQSGTEVDSAGDLHLSLKAKINLGLLMLPSTKLPIWANGQQAGQIEFSDGQTISVSANLTLISEDRLNRGGLLPSRDPVPVSGIDPIYEIKITNRSSVYFAENNSSVLFGFAVVIPELDRLGNKYPFLDIWFPIQGATTSRGVLGIFAGSESLTSGIGLFVANTKNTQQSPPASMMLAAKAMPDSKISFKEQRSNALES